MSIYDKLLLLLIVATAVTHVFIFLGARDRLDAKHDALREQLAAAHREEIRKFNKWKEEVRKEVAKNPPA